MNITRGESSSEKRTVATQLCAPFGIGKAEDFEKKEDEDEERRKEIVERENDIAARSVPYCSRACLPHARGQAKMHGSAKAKKKEKMVKAKATTTTTTTMSHC